MERFKAQTKFIQYQLWQDCKNGCKFCSERNQLSVDKKWALQFILNKLDDPEVFDYEEAGIIGGEIFDDQLDDLEVKDLFYKLIDKIIALPFKKIYIATALLYDINKHLCPLIDYLIKINAFDRTLFCTSYDLKYRFNTPYKKELWENNMLYLKEKYPTIKTHVETILTQFFIDAVLNKEFSIKEFCDKFKTRIDYIEPSSGMYYKDKKDCEKACPGFFPTKKSYIDFLMQEGVHNKNIDLTCMISYQIRANRIYHLDCGDYVCYKDRRAPGFKVICKDTSKKYEIGFIDSDDSMEKIAEQICKLIE